MIATTILKTLLPLLGYPRFPKGVSGPHNLIGSHRLRIPNSTSCQIFYPASRKSTPTSLPSKSCRHSYFRAEAAEGVANWINSDDSTLLSFLNACRHPCLVDATPKSSAAMTVGVTTGADNDSINTGGQSSPLPSLSTFPIVIFSHGLGGTMEMYTELCRTIASHGFIVFAMEHQDGSAAFAETVDGDRIYYTRPDDTPYSREKVLKLRGPMYDIRLDEVEGLLNYLDSYPKDTGIGSEDVNGERIVGDTFHELMAAADLSNGVSLLGHSFGATTMVNTQQQQHLQQRSSATKQNPKPRINSIAILDPWCFSLSDTSLTTGITSTPLLAILSATWGTNGEAPQVLQLLRNSAAPSTVLRAPGAVHSSFSDTSGWLPRVLGRKMGVRGRKEGRHETAGAAGEVCARFFQREQGKQGTTTLVGAGGGRAMKGEEQLYASCGTTILPFSIL